MADDTTLNNATVPGGDKIATEDIGGGVKMPLSKIVTGAAGVRGNVVTSHNPLPIELGLTAQLDAFERLRVTYPETLFDSKQLFDALPSFWDDAQISGAGTTSVYNQTDAKSTLSVANLTAGRRVRQTFRRFNYEPGKSQLILMTGVLSPEGFQTGNTKRIGYYDDNNGIFWQVSGSTVSFGKRKAAADTLINQTAWNVDKLDGTGASGITLDITKVQILFMDFQWLGVGTIRYGFVIDGEIVLCHIEKHANIITSVYMSTPNLPLRYEIINAGTGAVGSLVHICTSVMSEGGQNYTGYTTAVDRSATPLTVPNDTQLYASIILRYQSGKTAAEITMKAISVMSPTASASWRIALWLGRPSDFTIAGTVPVFTPIANSAIEYFLGDASNIVTFPPGSNALKLLSQYMQSNHTSAETTVAPSSAKLGSSIAGVSQYLVLIVQGVPHNIHDSYASMQWQEEL